jgi:transposase
MTKPDESVEAGPERVKWRRRGKWTAQQRRRIVADSRVAGASVQEVAERHGVRANLLSAWRRQDDASRAAKPVKFAAVKVSAVPVDGSIEIDLVAGCVRVRTGTAAADRAEQTALVPELFRSPCSTCQRLPRSASNSSASRISASALASLK